ncbi:hypothetical protein ACFV0T_22640 [Streptomyces sp. NPDC059582]|uniref:hypothetical protein n=1 Tax=Streptomyces sp. NPDC059582 TaxID=3346875 RepID=UPI0036C7305F
MLSASFDVRECEISDAGCGLVSGPVHGRELVAGGFEADPEAFFLAAPAIELGLREVLGQLRMISISRDR